ncbi:hypothetical protein Bca101_014053 [Brassica carinata]
MVLTHQLPDCMLIPNATQDRPTNVETSHDVEVLMSLHDWTDALTLCVTHGALNVAKYQFICRRPFNIGERRFLGDGVTEEQHTAEMLELVSGGEFVCSGSVLREICSEEQLVLVYRVSFEIRKAKDANEGIQDIGLSRSTPDVLHVRQRVVPLRVIHEMDQRPAETVGMTRGTRPTNPPVVVDIDGSSTDSTEGQGYVRAGVNVIDVDEPSEEGKSTHASPMEIPAAQTQLGSEGSTAPYGGGDISEILDCTTNMEENYEVITDDSATEGGDINGA